MSTTTCKVKNIHKKPSYTVKFISNLHESLHNLVLFWCRYLLTRTFIIEKVKLCAIFKTLLTTTNLFVFFIQWKKLFTLTLGTEFSRTSILNWCYGICDRVSKLFESSYRYLYCCSTKRFKFCFWHKLVLKENIGSVVLLWHNAKVLALLKVKCKIH